MNESGHKLDQELEHETGQESPARTGVGVKARPSPPKILPRYRVLLHNDDYTPMEFVVEILIHVFHKSIEDATQIMLNVHRAGVGLCGVYPCEVAEIKVDTVHILAKEAGFPLKCTMEKE